MRNLSDYILTIPNAVPLELCDELLKEYQEQDYIISTTIGDGGQAKEKGDYRRCSLVNVSLDYSFSENSEKRKRLDHRLHSEMATVCLDKYSDLIGVHQVVTQDTGYYLIKYEEGDYYKNHIDYSPQVVRTLSLIVVLNDGFKGGALSFFNGELDLFPKKGEGIMFPSCFMFDHEVKPVTAGERYSLVTWFV